MSDTLDEGSFDVFLGRELSQLHVLVVASLQEEFAKLRSKVATAYLRRDADLIDIIRLQSEENEVLKQKLAASAVPEEPKKQPSKSSQVVPLPPLPHASAAPAAPLEDDAMLLRLPGRASSGNVFGDQDDVDLLEELAQSDASQAKEKSAEGSNEDDDDDAESVSSKQEGGTEQSAETGQEATTASERRPEACAAAPGTSTRNSSALELRVMRVLEARAGALPGVMVEPYTPGSTVARLTSSEDSTQEPNSPQVVLQVPPPPPPPHRKSTHTSCGSCGSRFLQDAAFCNKCGQQRPGADSCDCCGNIFAGDAVFCRKCGTMRPGARLRQPRVQFGAHEPPSSSSSSEACFEEAADGDGDSVVANVEDSTGLEQEEGSKVAKAPPIHRQDSLSSVASEDQKKPMKSSLRHRSSVSSNRSGNSVNDTGKSKGCSLLRPPNQATPRSSQTTPGVTPRHSQQSCVSGEQDRPESKRGRNSQPKSRTSELNRMGSADFRMSRVSERESTVEQGRFEVLLVWSQEINLARRRISSQHFGSGFFSPEDKQELDDKTGQVGDMRWFVIHPSSLHRLLWDLFGLLLIAYDCIMVPLEVFEFSQGMFWLAVSWSIRIFWTLNMCMSFFVGYMREDGMVEMRPRRVARHYCMTWFTLDVVIVGFDWAEILFNNLQSGGLNRVGTTLRGVRMIRSVRLFRLLKAPEMTNKLAEYVPMSEKLGLLATIAKITCFFLWITHIFACLWWGVGRLFEDCSSCSNWIAAERLGDLNVGEQYSISFHWSLSAFSGNTSIVKPHNIFERIFMMLVLFLAFVVSASVVGGITTSMTRLQIILSEQTSKLAVLRRFLVDHHISRPLAVRVQRNAQHAMLEQKRKAPESSVELLSIISQPVLVEVHFEMHSRILLTHPFMFAYNDINPAGMRRVCHSAISMLSLHPKDVLFSDLEVPEHPKIYHLMNGRLIYQQAKRPPVYIEKGAWVCEANLWTRWTHIGTLRATSECRLLVLDAMKFQELVSSFPTEHASLYAQEFVDWLNVPDAQQTDLGPNRDEAADLVVRAFPLEDNDEDEDGEGDRRSSLGRGSGRSTFFRRGNSLFLGGGRRNSAESGNLVTRISTAIVNTRASVMGLASGVSENSAARLRAVGFTRWRRGSGNNLQPIIPEFEAKEDDEGGDPFSVDRCSVMTGQTDGPVRMSVMTTESFSGPMDWRSGPGRTSVMSGALSSGGRASVMSGNVMPGMRPPGPRGGGFFGNGRRASVLAEEED